MTPETMTQIIAAIGDKNADIIKLQQWANTPKRERAIEKQIDILKREIAQLEQRIIDGATADPEPQRWAIDQMLPRDIDSLGTGPLRRG